MHIIFHWLVSAAAIFLTASVVPGFRLRGFGTALIATLLIAVANVLVRPVLVFLTLPLTVLTLGLFLFVVDAVILRLCAAFLAKFEISSWLSAVAGAVVLAVADSFLHWALI